MKDTFPRKIFHAPSVNSPLPDIYKKLTEANAKYPPSVFGSVKSWLPDFTRAVELEQAIYRINVPGYFFKCAGANGTPDSSHESGLIIDRFNHRMNTVQNHFHRFSITTPKDTTNKQATVGVDITIDGTKYSESYLEKSFQLETFLKKDTKYPSDWYVRVKTNGDLEFYPQNFSEFKPTVSIGGVQCHVAILSNQRELPVNYPGTSAKCCGDFRLNYFVCTGYNSTGGIANSLIPIIPGMASSSIPTCTYDDGTYVSGGCCSPKTGGGTWTAPGITELATADLTYVGIYDKKRRCLEIVDGDQGDDRLPTVDGVLEAKGTYVYYYRESSNTDRMMFVPAKSSPTSVKPVTKIRTITTPSSCTYHIPSRDYKFDCEPKSVVAVHIQESNTASVYGKQLGSTGGGVTGTINGKSYASGTSLSCLPVSHTHTCAMDLRFHDIFVNTDKAFIGFKDKFIAQVLTLHEFTWEPSYTSMDPVIGHADFYLFDPTT